MPRTRERPKNEAIPVRSRRERNKEDKARRLREAAEALFRERGFAGTTMRDVAERADLGVGTVYAYVRDKHELLEMISREDLERTEEAAFRTLPRGGIEREIRHVFAHVYAHHAKDVELARVIVKELSFSRDATSASRAARFGKFFARIAERVARAQARQEIDAALVPHEVAAHVFGLHFYVLVLFLNGTVRDPDEAFASALSLAMRGMAAAPRRKKEEALA
jgi:AcrR family transcriptional regulator